MHLADEGLREAFNADETKLERVHIARTLAVLSIVAADW